MTCMGQCQAFGYHRSHHMPLRRFGLRDSEQQRQCLNLRRLCGRLTIRQRAAPAVPRPPRARRLPGDGRESTPWLVHGCNSLRGLVCMER